MPVRKHYITNTTLGGTWGANSIRGQEALPAGPLASRGPGRVGSDPGGTPRPGNTRVGQWLPTTNVNDANPAIEIDDPAGATPSATRQLIVVDQADYTGQTLAPGAYTMAFAGRANVDQNEPVFLYLRVTICTVDGGGNRTLVKNILTTRIPSEVSPFHTAGQEGWRNSDADILVAGPVVQILRTIGDALTALGHTFAANEKICYEIGYGANTPYNSDSIVLRLDYNNANDALTSWIQTPDIDFAGTTYNETGSGGDSDGGTSPSVHVQVETSAGGDSDGGAALSAQIHAEVGAGGDSDGGTALSAQVHSQVGAGGDSDGGTAANAQVHVEVASGGDADGGTSPAGLVFMEVASGGDTDGGTAQSQHVHAYVGTGGDADGGTAAHAQVYVLFGSGGDTDGGTAQSQHIHVEKGTVLPSSVRPGIPGKTAVLNSGPSGPTRLTQVAMPATRRGGPVGGGK